MSKLITLVLAVFALTSCAEDRTLPVGTTPPTIVATTTSPTTTPPVATAPTTTKPTTAPGQTAGGLTVLYAGHSFGRPFAENMVKGTRLAGINGHEQRVVFRGGDNGAPQAMWGDPTVQSLIKKQLDDGEVDVVILICCSAELIETSGQSDQAILDIVMYALDQNPATRFGLAMPWVDFPTAYATADEHRKATDALYPSYRRLADSISAAVGGADIFAFYHGAAIYEIRERFERGLVPELTGLIGTKSSSVFADNKGHPASMAKDAGTLIWLNAIYGVEPLRLPPINQYETDIREIAAAALAATP